MGAGAVGFGAVNGGVMELAMETCRGYKNYVDRNAGLSLSCGRDSLVFGNVEEALTLSTYDDD